MSWNSLRRIRRQCSSSERPARPPSSVAMLGQRLGGDQRALGAAVQVLGAALGRQGAAVELEVDLADPDRQVGVVADGGVHPGEPVGDRGRAQRRHDGEVGELALAVEHLLGRAAAAVAVAEGEQALGVAVLAAVVLPGLDDGAGADLGVVAADRVVEGVGEHPAAVEALPPEEVEGHHVGLGPVHLDGEEARRPRPGSGAAAAPARSRSSRAASRRRGGGRRSARSSAGRRGAGGRRTRRSACWCRARPTSRRSAPTGRRRPSP